MDRIAIIDSGSTKSNWAFIDGSSNVLSIRTPGINPYYQNSEEIATMLSSLVIEKLPQDTNVTEIFYYGAGCSAPAQRAIVEEGFKKIFPNSISHIDNDMVGAARSLFGHEKGIACIAGTGANTCVYDGEKIIDNIYSPGLALGDEGSGGYLGKLLARDYIREALPKNLMESFEKFSTDRKEDILDKVYKKPFPNRYLASLAPFVVQNQTNPLMYDLAYESFDELFKRCICRYENHEQLPIRFIGSIAFHLKVILEKVAQDRNLTIDKIVADPMEGLMHYHLKK